MMRLSPILFASFVTILAATTSAFATSDPIPGVDIIVHCNCPGHPAITVHTNGNGEVTLKGLVPGDYVATIDGKSLVAAIDRLAPSAPTQVNGKSRHSPSAREQGGGPAGASHGNSHSNGDSSAAGLSGTWNVAEGRGSAVSADGQPQSGSIVLNLPWSAGDKFSASYRREAAARDGVRIKFTVPSSSEATTYDALGRVIFVGVTIKY